MQFLPVALAPLAAYRQFIVYIVVPSKSRPGKTDKLPVDYRTGRVTLKGGGGAHDPETWTDAQTAINVASSLGTNHGVGFVITEKDPFWFLDIDGAYVNGAWSPIADYLCKAFAGAAVEVSSSGNGLHILGTGSVPPHGTRYKPHGLELYTSGRFVALTGLHAVGDASLDCSNVMPWLVGTFFPPGAADTSDKPQEWTDYPCEGWNGPRTDEELLRRALPSESSAYKAASAFGTTQGLVRFVDLWDADVEVLARRYPPDPSSGDSYGASEADAALAQLLAYWTGKNCERIKTLMFQSKLVRVKWDREDYIERTVLNACAMQTDLLADAPVVAPKQVGITRGPVPIAYKGFVTSEELPELFEGCFYVQDNNAALLPNGDIVDASRFKARFAGRSFCMDHSGDKSTQDAWDCFINNQSVHFPRVEGTCFRPDLPYQAVVTREGRDWVNVYKAPEIDRAPGDVTPFLNLAKKLLPNGDDSTVLLSFMAAVVQYPGVKFKWSIFLQGTEGNGKSTIVRCLRHALGHKYIFNLKAHMIDANFNGWLEGNTLYVADDIYTVNDRGNLFEALQSLITETEQPITYKGIESVQKQVCGNFFFTDNHRDALKKTESGRRICPLYCAQQDVHKRDADGLTGEWFADYYYPWLQNGGYAAVAEFLHTMQIDPRFNPAGSCTVAPKTSATMEAIEDGRTGVENDICEWLDLGEPGFVGDFISVTMLKQRLDKPMGALKIKETLGRLGFEMHQALPKGRTLEDVLPDGTRPILYVRSNSLIAGMTDPVEIAGIYSQFQNAALARRLLQGAGNGS